MRARLPKQAIVAHAKIPARIREREYLGAT